MKYAAKLDKNGHKDWKLPSIDELTVLFENRAQIGGFNEKDEDPADMYWSSSKLRMIFPPGNVWAQCFSNGIPYWRFRRGLASVRPVRSASIELPAIPEP